MNRTQKKRKVVGLSIVTIITLLDVFRIGNYFEGVLYRIYFSYAADLIMPFGFYFLLCIAEFKIKLFQKWYVKAIFIIGFTTLAEILQFFGIYALGKTFDFADIVMYILGVGVAVIIDRMLLKRFIPFWDLEKPDNSIDKN